MSLLHSITRIDVFDDGQKRQSSSHNSFVLSSYLLGRVGLYGQTPPIYSFVKDIQLKHPGMWTICVGYSEAVGGDTQIGFTGGCEFMEHSSQTIIREGREELGLIIHPEAITHSMQSKGCSLHAIDATKVISDSSPTVIHQLTQNKSKKWRAFGLIYGTHDQLLKLMQTPTSREKSLDQQNIDHVLLIHIDEICKIVDVLVTKNINATNKITWKVI
jgi:hypothetical protein